MDPSYGAACCRIATPAFSPWRTRCLVFQPRLSHPSRVWPSAAASRPSARSPISWTAVPAARAGATQAANFPNFNQDSLEICWRDWQRQRHDQLPFRWKNINDLGQLGSALRERLMQLDLLDAAGVVQWSGVMRFTYSRTWLEADPAGFPLQIWRFLINGD